MSYNRQSRYEPQPFQLNIPTRIYAGKGESERIGDIAACHGKRALVVSMRDLSGLAERAKERLEGAKIAVQLVLLENGEPTCAHIDSLKGPLRSHAADIIIGIGGGTAIDTAKALAIALTHPDQIWAYANLSNRPPLPIVNQVLPVIAVPTTSGTGSEVTPYSVLMNVETRQKGTIQQQEICPRIAILDPELTKTQPPHLTAATGVDAFVQAVESFISISKFSPVAEWAAKEAIAIVYEALPRVYRNPSDLELRLAMAWASALSGIAISHRGTTAVHAIAEPLGAIAHIPHGDAVAMCALPVLQRTWPKAPERFAALCDLLEPAGHGSGNQLRKAERALELIRELFLKVDMMKKAKDFIGQGKISDALFEDVKKYKFRPLGQHPAQFGDEELLSIVRDIVG